MSYEGTHWLCGHERKECDGNCREKEWVERMHKKKQAQALEEAVKAEQLRQDYLKRTGRKECKP